MLSIDGRARGVLKANLLIILRFDIFIIIKEMALINATVSQVISYGMVGVLSYVGLTLYKPRYWLCTAQVQHI